MKSVLIGCAVVLLVVLIGGGILFYQFIWKPGAAVFGEGAQRVSETVQGVRELGNIAEQLAALDAQIVNQGPWAAPADGLIEPEQLARWLNVELAINQTMQTELAALRGGGQSPSEGGGSVAQSAAQVRAAVAAISQLGQLRLDAKIAQVAALNAADMSLAEYVWVRQTGIAALVRGGMSVGLSSLQLTPEQSAQMSQMMGQAQRSLEQLPPELRGLLEQVRPGITGGDARPPATEDAPAPAEPAEPADDNQAEPQPASAAQVANFALVKDHAEAFSRAQVAASFGI